MQSSDQTLPRCGNFNAPNDYNLKLIQSDTQIKNIAQLGDSFLVELTTLLCAIRNLAESSGDNVTSSLACIGVRIGEDARNLLDCELQNAMQVLQNTQDVERGNTSDIAFSYEMLATNKAGRKSDQFILRFPDGVRGKVKDIALANRRSMNAELLCLIELGMQAVLKEDRRQNVTPQPHNMLDSERDA